MIEQKHFLTKQGKKKVEKELETLLQIKKEKSKQDAPQALHSEELDTEFVSYKEDMELLNSRIEELENVLKNHEIIRKRKKEEIDLGAKVILANNGKNSSFFIVGTFESDPNLGKLSNESPLGRALIGKKKGEEVILNDKMTYKIRQISY